MNVICNTVNGPMIVKSNDQVISKSLIEKGVWADDDINLMSQLLINRKKLKNEICFYDVGANIGTHTVGLYKKMSGQLKVRSFEAQKEIYHILCGNSAINNLKNTYLHNNAVSEKSDEEITIKLLNYDEVNNFGALELYPPVNSDQQHVNYFSSEKVKTVVLDSYDEDVDLIKIDVEGMEDKVLKGSINLIKKYNPMFFIEIHKTDAQFIIEMFTGLNSYYGYLKGIDLIMLPKSENIMIKDVQRVI
jgi:FkbM family methyltransferase